MVKFLVMGAGGVGAYFGGLLAKKGHDVTLVARGEHLKALQKNGLLVKSVNGDFHLLIKAVEDLKEMDEVDVVLFTTKALNVKETAEQILPILKEESLVVNLQNGVGNEEIIAEVVGEDKVLAGLTYIETTISAPGVISQMSKKRDIIFGERNGEITERAKKLLEVFQDAEIPTILSDNIDREIWKKFMFIAAFSAITTITEAAAGDILACQETDRLFRSLIEEVYRVAKANNILLTEDDVEYAYQFAKDSLSLTTKSSMQRDFEKKKPLEVDSLSGAVVRFGKKANVETPYHETVYGVLKLKEKLYR